MIKKILVIVAVCSSIVSEAQMRPATSLSEKQKKKLQRKDRIDAMIRQQEEGALVFNKQNVYGFKLNTNGWGAFFEKGFMKDVRKTNLLQLEISEIKHPKEQKVTTASQSGPFITFSSPFIYGKQNIFYQVKPGFGQQRLLGGKANRNGVAVSTVYVGGISLGLERPYYLRVVDASINGTRDIKFTSADSALFLSNSIIQGTGLRNGWGEMKLIPGLHGKLALRFDYGRFNDMVSAVEVGVNTEYYFSKPEIMLFNESKPLFFSGYVAILIGKRK